MRYGSGENSAKNGESRICGRRKDAANEVQAGEVPVYIVYYK